MRMVIAVWLSRWQAAFIVRSVEMSARLVAALVTPLAGHGRVPAAHHAPAGHQDHHHGVEEHAAPGIWLVAPRVSVAVWLAAVIAATTHRLHYPRVHFPRVISPQPVDSDAAFSRQPAVSGTRSSSMNGGQVVGGRP